MSSSKRPWGHLIQRELLAMAPLLAAGCGQPPPAVEPAPPAPSAVAPPAPVAIAPVADPPGAGPGVGPLTEVSTHGSDDSYFYNAHSQVVPAGPGVFFFYGFESDTSHQGAPVCAFRTAHPEVCAGFSFAPWSAPERKASWPAPQGGSDTGDTSKVFEGTGSWIKFTGGKEGVYAVRGLSFNPPDMPLEIDFLRPDGRVEPFLVDKTGRFSDAEIVEVNGGHVGVFRLTAKAPENRPYASFGALVTGRIVSSGGKRSVEIISPLHIGDVWPDARASDARDARAAERRAGYGPFRGVPLLDARGAPSGELAMVWVEAIPPASRESEAKAAEERAQKKAPRVRKGKQQCGRPDQTEFLDRITKRRRFSGDGCGGRASRSLSSPDVIKRLHVTRLDPGGKIKGDHVEPLPADYSAERARFAVTPLAGGGLLVDERVFDARMKLVPHSRDWQQASLPTPPMLSGIAPQRVLGGAFDPRSGEALLVYGEAVFAPFPSRQSADATQARRFSALGEPLGEAVAIPEFEPDSAFFSARAGASWVVMTDAQPPTFRVVGGPHHGASHPVTGGLCEGPSCPPALQFHGLAPAPDGRVEALFTDSRQNYSALIDGRTLLSSPGRPPPPGLVAQTALGSSMALRDAEGALALWFASPDGSAALLDAKPDGYKLSYNANVHQVWGDLVVVQVDKKTARATWLKAARTVSFPADRLQEDSGEQVLRAPLPGPVLPGGRWILPDTPGEPFEAPKAVSDALRECPVRLPTGPRRLLLGCSEIAPEQPFAPRVGVRVARY